MRICNTCGKPMTEGYCCGDGEEYFCSDECLYVDGYTPEQKEIDYEDGVIYWTAWEEETGSIPITADIISMCTDLINTYDERDKAYSEDDYARATEIEYDQRDLAFNIATYILENK